MKRFLMILLCVSMLLVPAMAVELSDYEYITVDGATAIDHDSYNAAVAEEMIASAGLSMSADAYWKLNEFGQYYFDYDAFEVDYAAALAAQEEPQEEVIQDEISVPSAPDAVDEPASDDDPSADEQSSVSDPVDLEDSSATEDESLPSDTEPVVSDEVLDNPGETVVGDEGSETHTYSVLYANANTDVSDTDSTIISGLKSVIISIFGEYEPVMTTGTVTETVGDVTTTTLYDTVAAGAAGVDYEWLAGVFLFGILLFCLMKLLGGILK